MLHSWTEADKQIIREQSRLGALDAFEELNNRLGRSILSKAFNMALGALLVKFLEHILKMS